MKTILLSFSLVISIGAHTARGMDRLELGLSEAEKQALSTSHPLKAATLDAESAARQESSVLAMLFPRLSFQAYYQYYSTIPTVVFGSPPAAQTLSFGTNAVYSVGPQLTYTLWDSFSAWKAYRSYGHQAQAKESDRRAAQIQTLQTLRTAYVQAQLAVEELQMIQGSLNLSRAQFKDVSNRLSAGAASKLEAVTAERSVLGFEIQFAQRQAELSLALKDLLALVGSARYKDTPAFSHPGPEGVDNVTLAVKLDALRGLLEEGLKHEPSPLAAQHPTVQSALEQAEALGSLASSQRSKLFPTLNVTASSTYMLPNMPNPTAFNQNTVAFNLVLPLWLGDPTWQQSRQTQAASDAASERADQLKINMEKDFSKSMELLQSLKERRALAAMDVAQSEEVSKLTYASYKAGKSNLIDVQAANTQALQAKLGAARLDAQTLLQIFTLKALSAEEASHE